MRIEKAIMVDKGPYGLDKDGVLRISDITAYCTDKAHIDSKGSLNIPTDVTFYPDANGHVGVNSDGVISPFEFKAELELPVIQG